MLKIYLIISLFVNIICIHISSNNVILLSDKEENALIKDNNRLLELLNKAQNFENNSKYAKAIDVYNEALNVASKNKLSADIGFIYNKMGTIYYKQKKYHLAVIYFKKSVLKDSLSQNTAESYFKLALSYRKLNREDSLLFHLRKSLVLYKIQKTSYKKYNTYKKAGILFKNSGNYNEAIRYLFLAYNGFEKLGNYKKQAVVCNSIAEVQRLLNNFDIAKEYYKEGLQLRKKIKDTIGISNSYNSIGLLYMDQKQYDTAIIKFNKAIALKKKINNLKEIGRIYNNLASAYTLNKEAHKALKTYKKALKIKKEQKDSLSIAYTYNELGLLSIKNNNTKNAKKYLDSSFHYLTKINNKDVVLRNYEINALYYKSIKNYEKSLLYKEKQYKLYEIIFNEKQAKVIQELQEKFEHKLRNKKILDLSKSNYRKEKIIVVQKRSLKQKNLLLIIIGLIALSIYLFLKNRQKTREKEYELNQLAENFKGQEIIKESISKDLHDIITSNYDGIRMKVLALSKAKDPILMRNEIANEITEINHQVRLISHRLSPLRNKIKESKLSEIIISQFSEFQYYRKIFMNIQLPLPKELDIMKLDSQTNFYGILLEVLSNVEKHSQATKVIITHHYYHEGIVFKIYDNGKGFNKVQQKEGIGLMNIKQRTLFLNGKCNIETKEEGTLITIEFPINKNLK